MASNVVAAFQRDDFYSFFVRCFEQLHGAHAYVPAWHAEALAARLAGVREGGMRRLIVNVPPRHMKSVAASIALPAWLLGHDPSLAIVNVSYAQHLSDKFARDCRAVMSSDWYQSLFQTRLASAREPLAELSTTAGGSRLATSIGGVITGRGADVIVIDDPLQPDDAMSESRRRAVNDWFDGTLYPRLNDKAKGAIVIVMQRLHEDDLVGHVTEKGRWEVLRLPAIAEEDEVHVVETRYRRDEFRRRAGEALQPSRESLSTLEGIRLTTGEFRFAAQYQQRPAPAGGGLIKADWFPRFRPAEAPAFDRIVQSWDTANKPSALADYSVCTTWGLKGPNFYLLNVLRKKLAFPDLKRAVKEQERLFHPQAILIEDKASGTQLIQDLIHEGLARVTRIRPDGDKTMRAHAQTAVIENGFVHLPDEAHWLADYLAELTVFPGGRYDDQVDSTMQALAWARPRPVKGQGVIDYWAEEAAKVTLPPPGTMVRLRAPRDWDDDPHAPDHVAVGGNRYRVKDGMVEVDGWDAKFLAPMGFEADVGQRIGRAAQEGRHPLDEIRAESERLIDYPAQRGGPPPADRVRLWAPQPFGQVHGWSGKAYDVRDHWVEVGLNDAAPLLRGGFRMEGQERWR